MAESKLSCLRCQGVMETGFTVDTSTNGGRLVGSWMAGEPEYSTFFGKVLPVLAKMKGRAAIHTVTYRCTRCGYLESYARTTPSPQSAS
jgi:hypothetical protein